MTITQFDARAEACHNIAEIAQKIDEESHDC